MNQQRWLVVVAGLVTLLAIAAEAEPLALRRRTPLPAAAAPIRVRAEILGGSSIRKSTPRGPGVEYASTARVVLRGDDATWTLQLKRNDALISPRYQHMVSGQGVVSTPAPVNCYYYGSVDGVQGSLVAVSACDGLHGMIHLGPEEKYTIHAVEEAGVSSADGSPVNGATHVLVRDDPDSPETAPGTCGVPSAPPADTVAPLIPRTRSRHGLGGRAPGDFPIRSNKSIELMLAGDYAYVQRWGDRSVSVMLEATNAVHAFYKSSVLLPAPYSVSVSLVGTYFESEPGWLKENVTTVEAGNLLSTFCTWRQQQRSLAANKGTFLEFNDFAHVLTGRAYTSASLLGLAYVGVACSGAWACGVEIVPTSATASGLGAVIAHEMGHNLGMSHDGSGNACPASGFIMAPSACISCASVSSTFSNCSKTYINDHLTSTNLTCLDAPARLCGNGILDPGEHCDSGNSATGNACCTPTCRYRTGAVCDTSNGKCCDPTTCKFRPQGTQCRPATLDTRKSTCDVADVCSGTSSTCLDVIKPNGTACFVDPPTNKYPGNCVTGVCKSRAAYCELDRGLNFSSTCGSASSCTQFCMVGSTCYSYSNSAGTIPAPDFAPCRISATVNGTCLSGTCVNVTKSTPTVAAAAAGTNSPSAVPTASYTTRSSGNGTNSTSGAAGGLRSRVGESGLAGLLSHGGAALLVAAMMVML
ncbi:hypothetical protein H9P43_008076 [Blastocladiella emersonii ATCC 22665]|nr:hypothetical protein H9P43_008076 [Blastocladiella emersonii ATCC 22665]